ncbi:MAG TPA: class I SAM-dependent methyltransferase [Blastocatellia bacterium]|nr:class I SAM-dependent methyltransferase [Blastocatellia bacterium]
MAEWFEDESFWSELYPHMFSDERMEIAGEQVEKALALAGFQGGAVLDLCCGPGRHSVELARRGIQVTAVDRTEYLLNKAKERAAASGLTIEFIQEDMRRFVRPGAFALALNLFTSFGYFDKKGEDLQTLRNIYESLQPGGALLMDIMGKEIVARGMQLTASSPGPDGSLLVERHEIFDGWSRMRNEWILIKGEKARSFKFHHTLYSGQELKILFESAGFAEVSLFGDLAGSEYGWEASRLIVVGRKSI